MKKNKVRNIHTAYLLQNEGSTLITVLVAVSFLVVLATIMISASASNLRMKQIEYDTKRNFYSDEQILDDIYNGIGREATVCLAQAYAETLAKVSTDAGEGAYKTQEQAYYEFSISFMKKFEAVYPLGEYHPVTSDQTVFQALNSYIVDNTDDKTVGEVVKYKKTRKVFSEGASTTPYQYRFEQVVVKFYKTEGNDKTGYESAITTDIVVEIPYINFFQDSSRILDYALIGNRGVYFNGATRDVFGNVYAGIDSTESSENMNLYRNEDVYGSLNFYNSTVTIDGTYLISKGDINIRKSKLTVGNTGSLADTQVWAETIRTVESRNRGDEEEASEVTMNGNLYVANDLELNARKSKVTLTGEYYGYNDKTYVTQEKNQIKDSYVDGDPKHTQSSSIIINGNKSELNLSGLKTLVLAGVAYVDLESRAYLGLPNASTDLITEYATGESLALKSNQYLYLAPSSCLTVTNPVKTSDLTELEKDSSFKIWSLPSKGWFGDTAGFLHTDPIIKKTVTNNTSGENYTYFYLNFSSEQHKATYVNMVLNMVDPETDADNIPESAKTLVKDKELYKQIWALKQELQQKATSDGVRSAVTVASDATASIYTSGTITQVVGMDLTTQIPDAASGLPIEYIGKVKNNIQKHYKYLYAKLDPKEQFSLTSVALDDLTTISLDQPASEFVKWDGLANNGSGTTYKCNGEYKTILALDDYTVTDSNFKGIIICKGNVTVNPGASVEGLVISNKKIYVKGTGSIKANRSIVQAIIDEEMTEESKKSAGDPANLHYAITHLEGFEVSHSGTNQSHRVTGTDYTEYISYENWKKGETY